MAKLPFTDSHVHFWDLRGETLRYDWLEPEWIHPVLGDHGAVKSVRYWPDDFLGETRFAHVGKVVHVQAAIGSSDPVEETRWLQGFADRLGTPAGIVGYVNLASIQAKGVIGRHCESAAMRGVRDLRYDDYLTDDAWQRGYSALEEFDLVFCDDPLLEVMSDAAALAARFPAITYCVDHAGWPRERDRAYFREWRAKMRELAGVPNTVVKISGLGMSDNRWTPESLRPWVRECIEAWGTHRAFFGTNWPVDRLFSSYGDVIDAYAECISDLSEAEQRRLFSENADRIFGLGDGPT